MHSKHKSDAKQFLQNQVVTMQEECLQSVFDAQTDGVILLAKSQKPSKEAEKKCDSDDSDSDSEEKPKRWRTPYYVETQSNSSIASFVNFNRTLEDNSIPFEIVFKNNAFTQITNENKDKSILSFIGAPCFVNLEHNTPLDLKSVTQGHFSDEFISQVYCFEPRQRKEGNELESEQRSKTLKKVTFQRNELFF